MPNGYRLLTLAGEPLETPWDSWRSMNGVRYEASQRVWDKVRRIRYTDEWMTERAEGVTYMLLDGRRYFILEDTDAQA